MFNVDLILSILTGLALVAAMVKTDLRIDGKVSYRGLVVFSALAIGFLSTVVLAYRNHQKDLETEKRASVQAERIEQLTIANASLLDGTEKLLEADKEFKKDNEELKKDNKKLSAAINSVLADNKLYSARLKNYEEQLNVQSDLILSLQAENRNLTMAVQEVGAKTSDVELILRKSRAQALESQKLAEKQMELQIEQAKVAENIERNTGSTARYLDACSSYYSSGGNGGNQLHVSLGCAPKSVDGSMVEQGAEIGTPLPLPPGNFNQR